MLKKILKNIVRILGYDVTGRYQFNDQGYHLSKLLRFHAVDVVFDIGANTGQFAISLRDNGYLGLIVSFEPLPEAYLGLLKNSSRDDRWLVHERVALGSSEGKVVINVSKNSVSSSILPMEDLHLQAADDSAYIDKVEVKLTTLDDILNKYVTKGSSLFIKMDAQGYEGQIMQGAVKSLTVAKGVMCELSICDLYKNQAIWTEIISKLESFGFSIWAMQKGFCDEKSGRMMQVDGIFFK